MNLITTSAFSPQCLRRFSSTSLSKMRAWAIHQYGGNDELNMSTTMNSPVIKHPSDVLIEVHATSVNPLDIHMRDGYGRVLRNTLNQTVLRQNIPQAELPLILGRDFSGVVVQTGKNASRFKCGDEVWGATLFTQQGSHADFTSVKCNDITLKPQNISHTSATSIPYVGVTSWGALCVAGRLNPTNAVGKRVLILGGSGGIGTFSIQMLKAWGAHVTTTCSTDAASGLLQLGVDEIVDYQTEDVNSQLRQMGTFDLVFDTLGGMENIASDVLKQNASSVYVTIMTPLLKNMDSSGLILGSVYTVKDLLCNVTKGLREGKNYRWAMFKPNRDALEHIRGMVEKEQINPVIDEVFPFNEVPAAFKKVENGHARGKTVIDMKI